MKNIIPQIRKTLVDLNFSSVAKGVGEDEDLFQCGALDSLTLIQFVLAVEEEFGFQMQNKDITYENFKSLRLISEFIVSNYLQKLS